MKYKNLLETIETACYEAVLEKSFKVEDDDTISNVISSAIWEYAPIYSQDIFDIVEELSLYRVPLEEVYHLISEQTSLEGIMKSLIESKIQEDTRPLEKALEKAYRGK